MKRFDILTETDARVLEPGSTVELAEGGIITPLAQDTLRERRITVLSDTEAPADAAALVPKADVKVVTIGSDHTGIAFRKALVAFLRGRGLTVHDVGTQEGVPYVVISVSAVLSNFDLRLEQAARNLGATGIPTFQVRQLHAKNGRLKFIQPSSGVSPVA